MTDPRAEVFAALARLAHELAGQELTVTPAAVHPSLPPARPGVRLSLGPPPASPHEGLFVDVERAFAVHHQGYTWTVYQDGRPRHGHAWDDQEPDAFGAPVPFEDWLYEQVVVRVSGRYRQLLEEFHSFRPTAEGAMARAHEMTRFEARLHRHWRARSATPRPGRFPSAGSAAYVGWLRTLHRYDEAVLYTTEHLADPTGCQLRHRSDPGAFEAFVNNGLGSFLDGDAAHLPQALQLLDGMAPMLTLGTPDALYQTACVLARAGATERALEHAERAVAAGAPAHVMAHDDDLASLHSEPRFRALLDHDPR